MSNEAHRDTSDMPTVIVDEGMLVDRDTIDDAMIQDLLVSATHAKDDAIVRMCRAALNDGDHQPEFKLIARGGCAELWNDRMRSEALGEGDIRDQSNPAEAPIAAGVEASIEASTLAPTRERTSGEDTGVRPFPLRLVEFQCPICHLLVLAEDARGSLHVPWHRIDTPIFPFGYAGPMFRVECPASLMEITQMCDGEHAPPKCDDPRCDQDDPIADPPAPAIPVPLTMPAVPTLASGTEESQPWEDERTSRPPVHRPGSRRTIGAGWGNQ